MLSFVFIFVYEAVKVGKMVNRYWKIEKGKMGNGL